MIALGKKELKLQTLFARSIRNSDTLAAQINISKNRPDIAVTTRLKYQNF